MPEPLMYSEIADWWPLLSRPEEYEEEAGFFTRTIIEASDEPPRTILELGSGGGNNASYMKAEAEMTLVDLAPNMLEVSKRLNPECEHIVGDMRTVRLGREFDAVFIHDAIDYMTSAADLAAAVQTAFAHTRAGGVALFCPDHIRETFKPSTEHGGSDADGRGLRYLQWTWDPDPGDTICTTDYAYLLRDRDRSVRVLHDRHECGLFGAEEWTAILTSAGFVPSLVPFDHSEVEVDLVVVVGEKPR
jgi:trans-aconitate methyltransferase